MTLWILLDNIIVWAPGILYLKVLAWEIYNMKWGFAKKVIIKSQWQHVHGSNFYESDIICWLPCSTVIGWKVFWSKTFTLFSCVLLQWNIGRKVSTLLFQKGFYHSFSSMVPELQKERHCQLLWRKRVKRSRVFPEERFDDMVRCEVSIMSNV